MAEAIVQQELQALGTFVKVLVQNARSISDRDAADLRDSGYSWLESISEDCKLFRGLVRVDRNSRSPIKSHSFSSPSRYEPKQLPFGAKSWSDICPWTLSVQSVDIICSIIRGHYLYQTVFRKNSSRKTVIFEEHLHVNPRTNIQAYCRAKWRLLCLLSFKYSSQHAQVW